MANRYAQSYPTFLNDEGIPYSGGKLYFYASGTSTPLDTYPVDTLTGTPNANPVILNSAGRPANTLGAETPIFLQKLAYKVVFKDANDVTIYTEDPVYTSDYSHRAQIRGWNGSPNGSVAGTAATQSLPADAIWDYTNNILYICTTTGSASTAVWTAVNAATAAAVVPAPQGRLSLASGEALPTSDQSAKTAVFWVPDGGNTMPFYSGSTFVPKEVTQLTLNLVAAHAADTNYDVFGINPSAVPTLVTGPGWSNSGFGTSSRGSGASTTELTTIGGFRVNAVSMTGRNGSDTYSVAANQATFLGTIRMTGSNGQTEDSVTKRFVWNEFGRAPRHMKRSENASSWTYNSATVRQVNANAANQLAYVTGRDGDMVTAKAQVVFLSSTSSFVGVTVGIGLNSTTSNSAVISGGATANNAEQGYAQAYYEAYAGLGANRLVWQEGAGGSGTTETFGSPSGIVATVRA